MPVGEAVTICDICKKHQVVWRNEELAFRQWSDKGYIQCRVELSIGTCTNCGSKSLQPDSDRILDAAFEQAYRKLT